MAAHPRPRARRSLCQLHPSPATCRYPFLVRPMLVCLMSVECQSRLVDSSNTFKWDQYSWAVSDQGQPCSYSPLVATSASVEGISTLFRNPNDRRASKGHELCRRPFGLRNSVEM